MVGSHKKWWGTPHSTFKSKCNSGMSWACFELHLSQTAAKSTPNFTSQLCGDFLQAICMSGEVELSKDHQILVDIGQAGDISLSKSELYNFWLYYTHEQLAYYNIHRVAVKTEPWNWAWLRPLSSSQRRYNNNVS